MSFEGYYQTLCENGHYDIEDCYMFSEGKSFECSKCGSGIAWYNLVDTTNGDESGYVKLEMVSQKKCEHCDSVLERVWRVPDGE